MEQLAIGPLPEDALAAAAHFHAHWLAPIAGAMGPGGLVLILPEADYTHRQWRAAALASLARAYAPRRINALAGGDGAAQAAALAWLAGAEGVTGQVLLLAGEPA